MLHTSGHIDEAYFSIETLDNSDFEVELNDGLGTILTGHRLTQITNLGETTVELE